MSIDYRARLNKINPTAADVRLGDLLQELITAYNDLASRHDALLAKLDADAGVTDSDYAASLSAADSDLADLNQR